MMHNHHKICVFILTISLFLTGQAKANIVENNSSSTQSSTLTLENLINTDEIKLLITKINFNNSENDWIEFKYDALDGKSINLKGLSFRDDKIFKTMNEDFIINSGTSITLTFNKTDSDAASSFQLSTDHKGLTATTEQIIIENSRVIFDAVCWASDKPAKAELTTMKELAEKKMWTSEDPATCFQSKGIKKETTIERIMYQDTNTANDWKIEAVNEPQKQSNSTKSTEATSSASKAKATSTKTTKAKTSFHNGTLSNELVINEIFPSPQEGEEWIELWNKGKTKINLGNWQLDDSDGGSKPYVFSDKISIEPNELYVVKKTESKLNLNNTKDEVRLFNWKNQIIDQVSYEETHKNESLTKTTIIGAETIETWLWDKQPTPGSPNPTMHQLNGTIAEEPNFEELPYSFILKNDRYSSLKITFNENIIAAPLAKASFTNGAELNVTVTFESKTNDGTNQEIPTKASLKKFEVISQKNGQENTKNTINYWFGLVIIIIIGGFAATGVILSKKKQKSVV